MAEIATLYLALEGGVVDGPIQYTMLEASTSDKILFEIVVTQIRYFLKRNFENHETSKVQTI